MRARELILEYSQEMMRKRYGAKLSQVYDESYLKYDWIENQYLYLYAVWEEANNAKETPEEDNLEVVDRLQAQAILEFLEGCDPTEDQGSLYTPWIVTRIISGKVKIEDVSKIKSGLTKFHALKTSGYFKRNPEVRALADIGKFQDVHSLWAFIDSVSESDFMSNTAKDKALEEEMIAAEEAIIVADKPTFKIVIPKTMRAAQHFGRNTRWCTAAKINNAFASYSQHGDLYIVLAKEKNRRWQFYFGPECQFMDERDEDITGYHSEDDFDMGSWTDIPPEALDVGYYKDALEGPKNPEDYEKLANYGPDEWKDFVEMLMEVHGISNRWL